MTEIWEKVKGFSNYEVSNMGRVRSLPHRDRLGRIKGGYIIKPHFDGKQCYIHVGLWENGKVIHRNVHRLVAEAFIENPNNYPEVNHKDEDKTNNTVENLEWCTHTYNNNYGTKLGKTKGMNNPMSKFDDDVVEYIKSNHKYCGGTMRNKDLAQKFNMSPTHVSSIAHGRRRA